MKRLPLLLAFLLIIFYKPDGRVLASLVKKTTAGVNIILSSEILPGRLFHAIPLL